MKEAVKTFLKNCPCCQKMSAVKIPLNSYTYTTSGYKPMECLNIDFIGPFPDKGNILVIIDTFTRFENYMQQKMLPLRRHAQH